MKFEVCASGIITRSIAAALSLFVCGVAHAAVASIYGGSDGLCGHRTASGERLNCAAMTAAHRTLPFGTRVMVCQQRLRDSPHQRPWPVGAEQANRLIASSGPRHWPLSDGECHYFGWTLLATEVPVPPHV